MNRLLDRLAAEHSLKKQEYRALVRAFSPEMRERAAKLAREAREPVYQNRVFVRGLIEIGNVCRNDCYYCGIRRGNGRQERYQLSEDEILRVARLGRQNGFRTFVLQGGENLPAKDAARLCARIKGEFPECAVTLSLGEYQRGEYAAMRRSGADRYLLRHETADREHYQLLHPGEMSFDNRMRCLRDLKQLGFQTGCGFMVGSPYQSDLTLAEDLKFVETFSPQMCGIGPFLPHRDTPFAGRPAGSAALTAYLLSLIRLIKPNILLPATTSLETAEENGIEKGILAGANVVMPNLTPPLCRDRYRLYDGKKGADGASAASLALLERRMEKIGHKIVYDRGDSE